MSENKLLEMINLYFDGELEKSKEAKSLSHCLQATRQQEIILNS